MIAPNIKAPPAVPPGSAQDPSIVDYLKTIGAPSDLASLAQLGVKAGVVQNASEYTGSAEQNTKLLGILRVDLSLRREYEHEYWFGKRLGVWFWCWD